MTYVIAEPCIGTKDTACVDACPVDCIHPKKDDPKHATEEMLYIDPVECIDCGACVPVCPVSAIFALDDLPEKWNASRSATPSISGGRSCQLSAVSCRARFFVWDRIRRRLPSCGYAPFNFEVANCDLKTVACRLPVGEPEALLKGSAPTACIEPSGVRAKADS